MQVCKRIHAAIIGMGFIGKLHYDALPRAPRCSPNKNDLTVTVSGDMREYAWHQERCDWLQVGNRGLGNRFVDACLASAGSNTWAEL